MSEQGGSATAYPPDSYYTHSAALPEARPPLAGDCRVDVAIIGGGYTGLSAALHLAQAGLRVAVLEAKRVGWGASGRNGGQIHSGQRQDPEWFEARYDDAVARKFFQMGEDAKTLVHRLIEKHRIACELKAGLIHAAHKQSFVPLYRDHVAHMTSRYNHPLAWLDREEACHRLGTDAYFGAIYDPTAGHLHPLKFALGLAEAAIAEGALIFENTPVQQITDWDQPTLVTPGGVVRADKLLLCGNGYMSGLAPELDARVMPINNFIAATRPLSPTEIPLPGDECASDSRFVINYWRMSADSRLLFGGGENYSARFPPDIKAFVRKPLSLIYPQFKDIEIDYAWGGTLAVTVHRVPLLQRLKDRVWTAAGFSGQGVTIAPLAGQILAEAVLGRPDRLEAYAALPTPAFPGGKLLRPAVLALGMGWFALRDRL
uniref:NAD(P)/FAD-dependent oxidoreductase n=1 Tax=Pararhizobium sp. IMCC3301 TaxID=3067904 RepID=UPI00274265F7|nr:FAD-binding oxidoreductase [Pararhizobium sp. IMCC3301]